MNLDFHPYISYANQELDWLPMDTKELYQRNLLIKTQKNLLEKYSWINYNFKYKFNSFGFRCQEFSDSPSILFLGCSLTVGIGLPLEKTWANIVAQKLNLCYYNLGIGGASNDTSFRLSYKWLGKLRPKIVVLALTYPHRLEVFSSNGIIADPSTELSDFYLGSWTANKNNEFLNKTKNCLAIKQLCESLNIKFISVEADKIPKLDLARDLAHPGVESNSQFSKKVLSLIE